MLPTFEGRVLAFDLAAARILAACRVPELVNNIWAHKRLWNDGMTAFSGCTVC